MLLFTVLYVLVYYFFLSFSEPVNKTKEAKKNNVDGFIRKFLSKSSFRLTLEFAKKNYPIIVL